MDMYKSLFFQEDDVPCQYAIKLIRDQKMLKTVALQHIKCSSTSKTPGLTDDIVCYMTTHLCAHAHTHKFELNGKEHCLQTGTLSQLLLTLCSTISNTLMYTEPV
jgi:hypothetical protein